VPNEKTSFEWNSKHGWRFIMFRYCER